MGLIRGTDDAHWGFELAPEGWHDCVIHESVEIAEKEVDGEKKRSLRIPLVLNGGDKPTISIFGQLDGQFGLRKIADVVVCSGVHKQLERDKNINIMSGIEEEVIRSDKFLNYIMAKLPGKTLRIEVVHQEYNKKKQANIVNMKPAGGAVAGSTTNKPKPITVPTVPSGAVPEEEGW